MKKFLLITTPLLLVACHQTMPPLTTPPSTLTELPKEAPRAGRYIALPGQAAVDTDAAFEEHAAQFTNSAPVTVPVAPVTSPVVPTVPAGEQPAIVNPVPAVTPVATIPAPAGTADGVNPSPVQQPVAGMPADAGLVQPVDNTPVGGLVDYTLRITNATPGRVFIEAQDAAGEIYPCGFMTGSQSISSVKSQVAPIKGPITVVVRDPDKPDAPELRRYKVTPPTGYAGKTIEITIISGGFYQVSVDGQVRYITPTPVGKPDLGSAASTPVTPPAPAPAADAASPAPAPAAPAPEQVPAGM